MALIATSIAAIVGYLAKTLKEQKSVKDFLGNFTEAAVNWIKPIFLEEDQSTEKDVLKNLKEDPNEQLYVDAIKNAIAIKLKKDPSGEKLLQEMAESVKVKDSHNVTKVNNINVQGDGGFYVQDNSGKVTVTGFNPTPPKAEDK